MPTIKVNAMFKSCGHMFYKDMMYMIGEETLQDISEQYSDCFEETEESQTQRTKLVELRRYQLKCDKSIIQAAKNFTDISNHLSEITSVSCTINKRVCDFEAAYNGWEAGDERDFNVIRKINV